MTTNPHRVEMLRALADCPFRDQFRLAEIRDTIDYHAFDFHASRWHELEREILARDPDEPPLETLKAHFNLGD